jgi:hypothetical protein
LNRDPIVIEDSVATLVFDYVSKCLSENMLNHRNHL